MKRKKWGADEPPSFLDLYETTLTPAPFFQIRADISTKPTLLPDTSKFTKTPYSHDVYVSWSQEGLAFSIALNKKSFVINPLKPELGDAVELFIDTRDNKESGYDTLFCHQFLFFPEKVDGFFGREVTRFRGEEKRDLANPKELEVKVEKGHLVIFIPQSCLYGFDPSQFDHIGFNYRVHESEKEPQLFTALGSTFNATLNFR